MYWRPQLFSNRASQRLWQHPAWQGGGCVKSTRHPPPRHGVWTFFAPRRSQSLWDCLLRRTKMPKLLVAASSLQCAASELRAGCPHNRQAGSPPHIGLWTVLSLSRTAKCQRSAAHTRLHGTTLPLLDGNASRYIQGDSIDFPPRRGFPPDNAFSEPERGPCNRRQQSAQRKNSATSVCSCSMPWLPPLRVWWRPG